MSLDAQKFIMMIKQAAVEAVNAGEPMALKIGEVVSTAPLKISLNQKITLPASQLLLTNAVRDYTVYETVDHTTGTALGGINLTHKHSYSGTTSGDETYSGSTESAGGVSLGHTHSYTGRKKFTVHLGLKTGEKVLLLRCDGGQKFIVLGLCIKPNRCIKQTAKEPPDMMGYVVSSDHTTIRARTFVRARRALLRAWRRMVAGLPIYLQNARRIVSYRGYFKYTNSQHIAKALHLKAVHRAARKVISKFAKGANNNGNESVLHRTPGQYQIYEPALG